MSLDNAVRNNVLDALNGVDTFNPPTLPLKCRFMTANGSATVNGTELATGAGAGTGAGYTAGGVTIAMTAAGAGAASPTAAVRVDNMPTCTIVGAEVWDSAGTPKRFHFAPLAAPKSFVAADGDSFEIPMADFDETLA